MQQWEWAILTYVGSHDGSPEQASVTFYGPDRAYAHPVKSNEAFFLLCQMMRLGWEPIGFNNFLSDDPFNQDATFKRPHTPGQDLIDAIKVPYSASAAALLLRK